MQPPSQRPASPRPFELRPSVLALAVAALVASTPVQTNPSGAQVVQGQATLRQQGSTLTVTTSDGTIINWKHFGIGAGETTRFVQPGATSQVLNRVVGSDPSQILGTLESNGRVFLINPNGVAFGKGARVDVAGLVVSTLKLSDADFNAGRMAFGAPGSGATAGAIRNEGRISTPRGGFVYLVAPQVENSGLIHTPEGEVILAAGHRVSLVNPRTPEVAWEVTAPESQAINLGEVVARRIVMQGTHVRNAGTLQATTAVVGENGQVLLKAERRVEQTATGRIVAQGLGEAGVPRGGQVDIFAGEQATLQGRIEVTPGPALPQAWPLPGASTGERLGAGGLAVGPAADARPGRPTQVAGQPARRGPEGPQTAPGFGGPGVLGPARGSAGPAAGGVTDVAQAAQQADHQPAPHRAPEAVPVEVDAALGMHGPGRAKGAGAPAANAADGSSLPSRPAPDPAPAPQPAPGPDPRHALPAGVPGTGGRVRIFARDIALGEGLSIDAGGPAGGGTVLVGGEKQGAWGGAPNARSVFMHETARIAADAKDVGNGGYVILWADERARVHGRLSARGGLGGGDGGFIETSGMRMLDVTQPADASAPQGRAGTWLLDPNDIEIVASPPDQNITTGIGRIDTTGDSARVAASTIIAALQGSNVVVSTGTAGANNQQGNITVSAPIVMSAVPGARTLTLSAHNDIVVNAGIQSLAGLNVELVANSDSVGGGQIIFGRAGATSLQLAGGTLTLKADARLEGRTTLSGHLAIEGGRLLDLNRNTLDLASRDATLSRAGSGTATIQLSGTGGDSKVLHGDSSGTLTIGAGVLVTNGGGTQWSGAVESSGVLVNRGTVSAASAQGELVLQAASIRNEAGGTLAGTSGKLLPRTALLVNAGILEAASGATVGEGWSGTWDNQGVVRGTGTLRPALLNNAGTIQPGGAGTAGELKIQGDVNLLGAGVLVAELAGVAGADVLSVAGTLTLGGTLQTKLIEGFVPQANSSFVPLIGTPGAASGDFVAVRLPAGFSHANELGLIGLYTLSVATDNCYYLCWTGQAGTTAWSDAGNWADASDGSNRTPSANDVVQVYSPGTVRLTGAATVRSLHALAGSTLEVTGSGASLALSHVNAANASTVRGDLKVTAGGTLGIGGGLALHARTDVSGGTLSFSSWSNRLSNHGSMNLGPGAVTAGSPPWIENDGRLEVDLGPQGVLQLGTLNNLDLLNGTVGTLTLLSGTLAPAGAAAAPSLINSGLLVVRQNQLSGPVVVEMPLTSRGGTLDLQSGQAQVAGAFGEVNGVLRLGSGTRLVVPGDIRNKGELVGSGTLALPPGNTLTNDGLVRPGDGPNAVGTLTVDGNLRLGSGSFVELKVLDDAGLPADKLEVTGTIELGGTLQVNVNQVGVASFLRPGDSFALVTGAVSPGSRPAESVSGASGLGMALVYEMGEAVILGVTEPGAVVYTNRLGDRQLGSGGNWSFGAPPGATDTVYVFAGSGVPGQGSVTFDGSIGSPQAVDTLHIGAHGSLQITAASLTVSRLYTAASSSVGVSGGGAGVASLIVTGAGPASPSDVLGTLSIDGGASFLADAGGVTLGNVTLNSGTLGGNGSLTITGAFNVTGNGDLSGTGTLTTQGATTVDMSVSAGRIWLMGGKTWVNEGVLTLPGDDSIAIGETGKASTLVNAAGATLTVSGSAVEPLLPYGPSLVSNAGTFSHTANRTSTVATDFSNTGTLSIQAGTLSLPGSSFVQDGLVDLQAASASLKRTAGFVNAGTLTGVGTVDVGTGTLTNSGLLAPGGVGGLGTLTVSGNLVLGTGGTLDLDIRGALPADADRLAVSGVAGLGGTVKATLRNGYQPMDTVAFDVVTAGTGTSGNFENLNLPADFSGSVISSPSALYRLTFSRCPANTLCWDGGGGSNMEWTLAANWSGDRAPGPGDNVLIATSGIITVGASAAAGALTVSGSGLRLDVLSSGRLSVGLASTGTADLGGSSLVIAAGGTASFGGAFTTTGLVDLPGGSLNFAGPASMGTLNLGSLGTLTGTGSLTVTRAFSRAAGAVVGSTFAGLDLRQADGDLRPGSWTVAGPVTLTTLDGTGTLAVDGELRSIGASGDVRLHAAGRLDIDAPVAASGSVRAEALSKAQGQGRIGMGSKGSVSASGGGEAIVLAAGDGFYNNGTGSLSASNGRWLVYVDGDPDYHGRFGLAYGFKHYGVAYSASTPYAGPGQGNGFLYSLSPAKLSVSVAGSASRAYDGSQAAPLTGLSASASGAIFGDAVDLKLLSGQYAGKDAGPQAVTLAVEIDAVRDGAARVYGYSLASPTATFAGGQITRRTVSLEASKVYDGTTGLAGAVTIATGVGSETLSYSGATASDAHVATPGKFISAITLGNAVDGSGGLASNYELPALDAGTAAVTITPRVLTVSGSSVAGKTYDATTNAVVTVGALSGFAGAETVTASAVGSFDSKDAGPRTVTASYTLADGTNGGRASNYTLGSTNHGATIAPKALVVSGLSSVDKVYDGTTAATVTGSAALLFPVTPGTLTGSEGRPYTGDAVSLGGTAVGSFNAKDVASASSVSFTGLSLSGAQAGSYTLLPHAPVASKITPRLLSVSGVTALDRAYDGTTLATLSGGTLSGVLGGDTVTLTAGSGAFLDRNVGSAKPVTVSGYAIAGPDVGNYALAQPAGLTASISRALISSVTGITAANKVYDGTTAATLTTSAAGFTGMVAGDTLAVASATGSFSDKNAGANKTVSISGISLGGADAGNYTLGSSTASTTADITRATISAVTGITASNKTYDGTTAATLTTSAAGFAGMVAGDKLAVATATGAFADKNAGAGKAVSISGISLGGADAGNYTLASNTSSTTADITRATISAVTGITAGNKVYDGSTDATLTTNAAGFTGMVAGDTLAVATAMGSFSDKNAAAGKIVSISGIRLGGADAGNYTLASSTASTTADITRATISAVAGITAANKTYDGTTAATLTTSAAGFTGMVAGDTLAVASATGSFSDKNAGANKTVSISGISLGGADAGNYTLGSSTASTTADITRATISAVTGITAGNKVYDGTTAATLTTSAAGFTGMVAGDKLAVAMATGAFADKNAGAGKAVSISGISLGGADAGNYTLASSTASATADITRATISTVTGITAANKVYDGSTDATLTTSAAGFAGMVAGDTLAVAAATGSFSDKNAGAGKAVNVTGITLGGQDARNYTLATNTATVRASIDPRSIGLGSLVVADKVYDGTTMATVLQAQAQGVLAGDAVEVAVASALASFSDRHAGSGKPVSVSGLALAGADAGNYRLGTAAAQASAAILPRTLALGTLAVADKVYDGTSSATVASASLEGLVAGDAVALDLARLVATFVDKDAGRDKTVAVSGLALAGADATNYRLAAGVASARASIAVRPLSTWTGSASGNWSDAANWDVRPEGANVASVRLPAAGGTVTFDAAAPAVTLQDLSTERSLVVASSGLSAERVDNRAGIVLAAGVSWDLTRRFVTGGGTFTNRGSLTLVDATLDNALLNEGGSVAVGGRSRIGPVTNAGRFTVLPGGVASVQGTFRQTAGSTTLGAEGAALPTLAVAPGAGVVIDGGEFAGSGTVEGNLVLGAALLAPGYSPGAISVGGDLSLGPASTTFIELGGTQPGTFDALDVAGQATLDGTLRLASYGGFTATGAEQFTFLRLRGSLSGGFASFVSDDPKLAALPWSAMRVSTPSGTLTARPTATPQLDVAISAVKAPEPPAQPVPTPPSLTALAQARRPPGGPGGPLLDILTKAGTSRQEDEEEQRPRPSGDGVGPPAPADAAGSGELPFVEARPAQVRGTVRSLEFEPTPTVVNPATREIERAVRDRPSSGC